MPQRLLLRAAQFTLALFTGAYLLYFFDHARNLLAFPYPLDYGEGPLLAQVDALLAGTPIWRLYADPAAPPFLIVNYPPLYLLLTAALAPFAGGVLAAGRLISLLATMASVAAIALLSLKTDDRRPTTDDRPDFSRHFSSFLALLFLTIPIVREWSALMRVDMLGLCLGLWGLVVLTGGRTVTPGRSIVAGLLLAACLFTKPSLIAAPGAATVWLIWRALRAQGPERRSTGGAALTLVATLALTGALGFALLQWASGGWFALHVVAANANTWVLELASGFWRQQLALRWPLAAAAALVIATALWARRGRALLLPVSYTLLGVVTAAGVGKVGAYSNYFLELYAGLVWIITAGVTSALRPVDQVSPCGDSLDRLPGGVEGSALHRHPLRGSLQAGAARAASGTVYVCLIASLLYYPPLWDATRLRPAGLIEPSPPRLAFGRYGLWADARREGELLAAQTRVGDALTAEVRAAGPLIFTDMPGVAAAAGVTSRLQAFEARQLLDQNLADEGELLRELANGTLPIAVIDYLGNWLTPGVVTIIQRRYAHDGSLGTFDRYRPVAVGAERPLDLAVGALRLHSYSLADPPGEAHEPGAILALSLTWSRPGPAVGAPTVVVQLTTADGRPLLAAERPLLYGVYPPEAWPPGAPVQHLHPLTLPAELPDGRYGISVTLRDGGVDRGAPQPITTIAVAEQGGGWFEATGHFVPARLMRAWAELGGPERAGLPLTPAVPFAWGRLQCFERVCLELHGDQVRQRPLGTQLYLAETLRAELCQGAHTVTGELCPAFAAAPEQYGELGAVLSGELERNGWSVQWTEQARLERADDGTLGLGRLGDESLRLPPGTPYRWP